ncbi:ATP-binding cassette domain-containing protein [Oenococcus sp. UCMA 17063]|nr:ATP-binding cassette domain-containing protein [Oenococcus sp. UCMA 17063]
MKISNINIQFKDKVVFSDMEIQFLERKINWLKGDNGSGKTTLFRLLSGLLNLENEENIKIITDYQENISLSDFVKEVNFIPDRPYLFDYLTGRQNIQYLTSLFDLEELSDKIQLNLKKFVLTDSLDYLVRDYSIGMKIKLYLSVALERKARLLLIDEAINNIDESARKEVFEMLKENVDEGSTVVYTSHIPLTNYPVAEVEI